MRYSINDFNPSGFAQTKVRLKINGPPGNGPALSADTRGMLNICGPGALNGRCGWPIRCRGAMPRRRKSRSSKNQTLISCCK